MKIESLTAFEVPIRLEKPIRHASHARSENDTLIIRCQLNDGTIGWGEGLPRTYVTGESIASVWRHLTNSDFTELADLQFSTIGDAVSAVNSLNLAQVSPDPGIVPRECFGNSVRCALELAVLDAVSASLGCPFGEAVSAVSEASGVATKTDEVFYSGVITAQSGLRQWSSALKMKLFGFRQLKVKVGTPGISDEDFLRRVRSVHGAGVDIRLDANEAWQCDEVVDRMQPLLRFQPSSLEQPVPHDAVAGLTEIRQRISVPIMLDESLCCLEDAERAIRGEFCDSFNLRLSKCGGFVNSLKLAALAHEHGLGYQLGCQVGETGILSAAGRHFACNVAGIRYFEGSYDRFLVRETLTKEDMTFGFRGRGRRLCEPGLGITVNEQHVRTIARRTECLIGGLPDYQ